MKARLLLITSGDLHDLEPTLRAECSANHGDECSDSDDDGFDAGSDADDGGECVECDVVDHECVVDFECDVDDDCSDGDERACKVANYDSDCEPLEA